jgi:chitosanase
MRVSRILPLVTVLLLGAGAATQEAGKGLHDAVKKDIAMQIVSAAENSSLDWKTQYAYIEYNVEHNAEENRGYTAGIIGFTSRTHDMLELVTHYEALHPGNPLTPFLPALRKVDGSPSTEGLGKPFERAWGEAAKDGLFRKAQDDERDRVYFDPAVDQGIADGLHELGQFCYYDAIVMHGPGNSRYSFGGIRKTALAHAKSPAQGGEEGKFIAAFLEARVAAMKHEEGHQDTTRVDTAQRRFLSEKNWSLALPLKFKVYGDDYEIK